jgi:hypothetical protein
MFDIPVGVGVAVSVGDPNPATATLTGQRASIQRSRFFISARRF